MRTALRFRGKRPSRPSIVATAASATNSLLFLVDGHSAKRFLVDTGAAVSVYPASFRDINGGSHTRSLVAANGSNIATYGTRRMNIRLENQDEIKARWKESFETLLNVENEREEFEPTDPVQGPIPSVNDAEIKKQLSKMGRNKACGPDDLPIEAIMVIAELKPELLT